LAQADDDDKHALLLVSFCALHDIEAEEKIEEARKMEHESASTIVNLDEPCA
jgi:hypothetical protein